MVQISKTWKLVEAGYLDTLFNVINHIAAPVQHAVRTNTVVEIVQIGEGAYVCVCVGSCVCGWVCTMECTAVRVRVRINVCAYAEGLGLGHAYVFVIEHVYVAVYGVGKRTQ